MGSLPYVPLDGQGYCLSFFIRWVLLVVQNTAWSQGRGWKGFVLKGCVEVGLELSRLFEDLRDDFVFIRCLVDVFFSVPSREGGIFTLFLF